MIFNWTNFHLNELRDDDYGIKWPEGTRQLSKELIAFKTSLTNPGFLGIKSPFIHAVRVIRRLWPEDIQLFADCQGHRIYNTYFFDVLKACCEFSHCAFTGPASSAKTFSVSVYNLLMFYSSPSNTLAMISTTSGAASERRIWADIKSLHRSAKFEEQGIEPIGEIVDYLKCLVFDFDKSADPSSLNKRDLRNAIQVIPIANDSKGDASLNTIMGSKNKRVLWTIDEMPAMADNVDRPCANLEVNPFFQSIFIGNAQFKTDPHGLACEPEGGWSSVSFEKSARWKSKSGRSIFFLHGENSPNDDHRIDMGRMTSKSDFPFPYLANKVARESVAIDKGRGIASLGKMTIDYIRFCIGKWAGDDAQNTVITEAFVKRHKANLDPDPWSSTHRRTLMALDPAFTSGGDANSVSYAEVGTTIFNEPQILFCKKSIEIRPAIDDNTEYQKAVASDVVTEARKRTVDPTDFGLDISNDGGTMLQYIQDEWKRRGQVAISSNQKSGNDKYGTKVTEYWFSVADIIGSGKCRGFALDSNYFIDLSQRRYSSVSKDSVEVETKKDMKKRIRRSPDNGDSFAYLCYMLIKARVVKTYHELILESIESPQQKEPEETVFTAGGRREEETYHSGTSGDYDDPLFI